MKKVALSLVALFALAMVSCNGNKENTTEAPATDSPVVEAPADSVHAEEAPATDTPAVEAPADSANVQK